MANDKDDDLELLTDEERAALEADEGEEIDGSASLTGEDTQQWVDNGWAREHAHKDDSAEDVEAQAASGDKSDKDGSDEDAEGADAAAEDDPEPEKAAEPDAAAPQPRDPKQVQTPQHDAQMKDLRDKRTDLFQKFNDGEIDEQEFAEQEGEIQTQAESIIEERATYRQRVAAEETQWDNAVASYFKAFPDLKADQAVMSALDAEVKDVTSNPAYSKLSFEQQLSLAHRRLEATAEDLGLSNVPPSKKAAKKDPAPQQKKAAKKEEDGKELHTPPQTLARVPASKVSDEGDSKFAYLQRMMNDRNAHPDDIEAEIAKLSDAERDEFSSANL
jgi:transposase